MAAHQGGKNVRAVGRREWALALACLTLAGGLRLAAVPLTVSGNVTDPTPNPFDGGTWSAGTITIGAANTLTNNVGGTFQVTGSSGWQAPFNGGGKFLNRGTFEIYQRYYVDSFGISLSGGTTFENQGTLFAHRGGYNSGTAVNLSAATDTLRLRAGSTFQYNPDGFYGQSTLGIDGAGVVTCTTAGVSEAVNLTLAPPGFGVASYVLSLRNTGASDLNLGTLTLPAGDVLEQNTSGTYTWRGNLAGSGKMQVYGNGTFRLGDNLTVNFGESFVVSTADVDTNGFTLTSPGYFNWNGSDTSVKYIRGGGTVRNNGTLYCRGWNVTTYSGNAVTGGTTLDNNGTLSLGTNYFGNASLTLVGATDRVLMRSGSTLRYAAASGAGGIGGAGQFVLDTSGGNPVPINITVDAGTGTLKFLNTQSVDFNLADLNIGAGATLQLSGAVTYGWRGDMSSAGRIIVPTNTDATLRLDGDVTADLAQGLDWGYRTSLNLNSHTLTNAATGLLTYSSPYGETNSNALVGPGTLVNNGTWSFTSQGAMVASANAAIDNYGTMKFTIGSYLGSDNVSLNAGSVLTLRSGSTLWRTADNPARTVYIGGAGSIVSDTDLSGNPVPINIRVDSNDLTFRTTNSGPLPLRLNFASLSIATGASLTLQNIPYTFRGTVAADGALNLSSGASAKLETDTTFRLTQGLVMNSPSTGAVDLNGHTLTNDVGGLFKQWIPYGNNAVLTTTGGAAAFLNKGTASLNSQTAVQINANVTFQNQGTFSIDSGPYNNVTFNIQSGGVLQNDSGGTILANVNNAGMRIYGNGGGTPGVFRNSGTVSVPIGTLQIDAVNAAQWYAGNTLLAGGWSVGGTGALNLYPGGAITTIGAGATVTYDNGGTLTSNGTNLKSSLTTVNGALFVNGAPTFTPAGGALNVGGTIGGSGTFAANVTLNNGTVALNAGAITGTMAVNGGAWNGTGSVSGLTSVATGKTYTVAGTQTGNVTLGAGATLAGSGTIAGTVIAAGAVLAPGTSPGTLTMTTLSLDSTSVLNFELGDSLVPGASDRIDTTNLTLDGTLIITGLSGFGIPAGAGFARYPLLSYQNLAADGGLVLGTNPGGPFNYVLGQTTGVGAGPGQVFLIIPEPATGMLLCLMAGAALGRRRRQNSTRGTMGKR